MPTQEELFAAVDALLHDSGPRLPEPAERARLREAAGVPQARLAQVLRTTTQTVKNWEAGRSEPRPPRLEAYARLLEGWAQQHPVPAAAEATVAEVPSAFAARAAQTAPPAAVENTTVERTAAQDTAGQTPQAPEVPEVPDDDDGEAGPRPGRRP
ncbi:DNA-binding transcriptional regulator, partial [Kitasatospora sp. MBT63]|uniref:helix-turn-helix domain-containing protein n=1 Tax=Kitasatospora sp. MBT63 TaxID=1444768 RepID=UPI0011EA650D